MAPEWTVDQLQRIDAARELEISGRSSEAKPRRWLPIWVVCVDGQVYVRTWYRRSTGWFGHAVETRTARIRVPGLEADVGVEDLGDRAPTAAINHAYEAKYGGGGTGGMTTEEAVAATLRLVPSFTTEPR
jgi:hypothetical protein